MSKKLALALVVAGVVVAAAAGAFIVTTRSGDPAPTVYRAELVAMNTAVTGLETTGDARFTVDGDELTIAIELRNTHPGMSHWQHFHGFTDNRASSCPTTAADTNQAGIVDLIETEPRAGVTMVPFNADPMAMDVASETYPVAAADGSYSYHNAVSLHALQSAFANAFHGQQLDLDRRVVFIHGVPAMTALAATVQSLGPIPPQVTLPIACGSIERMAP